MDDWAKATVVIKRPAYGEDQARVITGLVRERNGWLQIAAPFMDGDAESDLPRSIPAHRVIEVIYQSEAEHS